MYVPFDYHAQMKQSKDSVHHLLRKLSGLIDEYGFHCTLNNVLMRFDDCDEGSSYTRTL